MSDLLIKSNIRDYRVVFEKSVEDVTKAISTLPNKVLVVDANVLDIYRSDIESVAGAERSFRSTPSRITRTLTR